MKDKKYIVLSGILNKVDNSEISENEMDSIMSVFIEILEKRNFIYGGGFGLYTEEEADLYFRNF